MGKQKNAAPPAVDTRAVLIHLNKLKILKDAIVGELFDRQREVALSKEMFTVLLCGRRSGKSRLIAAMIVLALLDCEAGEHVWFCAMSGKKAREIIWEVLFKIVTTHRLREDWGWDVNESSHSIRTPAGGEFQLLGVSEERNIDKPRGNKFRLFVCDEASTYAELLGQLLYQSVLPALGESLDPRTGKRVGRLVVAGTPNGALFGTFYEISTGLADAPDTPEEDKWKVRTWCMEDNPHVPDPEAYMHMIRRKMGWAPDNAVFLSEYRARWVANNEILVVPEWHPTPAASLVDTAGSAHWSHYIGIDYGFSPDFCAATVIAARRGAAWARVVAVWKENKLDDVAFAERIKELVERFRPLEVVGDTAGAGSRAIAMFNDRYSAGTGVYISAAKKDHKRARIDALNTALRRKLLFIDDTVETQPLRLELPRLRWRDSTRTELDPRCDDHAYDSLNYAFMTVRESLDEADAASWVGGRASSDEAAEREMLEEMERARAMRDEALDFEADLW